MLNFYFLEKEEKRERNQKTKLYILFVNFNQMLYAYQVSQKHIHILSSKEKHLFSIQKCQKYEKTTCDPLKTSLFKDFPSLINSLVTLRREMNYQGMIYHQK